ERLESILAPWRPGPCPITVEYVGSSAAGALNLGAQWSVRASRELLEQLEGLLGRDAVQVLYGAPAAPAGNAVSADLPGPPGQASVIPWGCKLGYALVHGRRIPRFRTTDRRARSEDRGAAARDLGVRGQHSGRDLAAAGEEPSAHLEHLRQSHPLADHPARPS